MKKQLIFVITLFLGIHSGFAQKMSDLFIQMPDSLVQTLDKMSKTSLIEAWKDSDGQSASIQNKLGGKSEIKELTDDYLFLQTSAGNSVEIKLLPINEYYRILCFVKNGCAPACDGKVSFYTVEWKPLKNNYFTPVSETVFHKTEMSEKCVSVKESLDMHPIKYSLNKNNLQLTATYSVGAYLNKDDYETLKPCLREICVFDWVDGRFLNVKEYDNDYN